MHTPREDHVEKRTIGALTPWHRASRCLTTSSLVDTEAVDLQGLVGQVQPTIISAIACIRLDGLDSLRSLRRMI